MKFINGSLDVESLGEAPKQLGDVLEDKDLSADQKLKTLVTLYSELNEESEMLRIRLLQLEKEGGGGGGGGGELTPEVRKILDNAESNNQKLSQIMLELTTVKEAKEALEAKLKEVRPCSPLRLVVAVLHFAHCENLLQLESKQAEVVIPPPLVVAPPGTPTWLLYFLCILCVTGRSIRSATTATTARSLSLSLSAFSSLFLCLFTSSRLA
jgi:hypothetical protein